LIASLAGVAVTPIACAKLVGVDDVTYATDAAAGAERATPPDEGEARSGEDASDEASDADAGGAGPPNLIANPSFEDGIGGCGSGWNVYNGTLWRSPEPHNGAWSCMVCATLAAGYLALRPALRVVSDPKSGDQYAAEVWWRAPADASAAVGVYVAIDLELEGGSVETTPVGPFSPLSSAWQLQVAQFPLQHGGVSLTVYLEMTAPGVHSSTTLRSTKNERAASLVHPPRPAKTWAAFVSPSRGVSVG
jgi:hypothetical protein